MGVTINVNGLSLCHKGSNGITIATAPDVCKTPPVPLPIPYPNIAFSSDLEGGTTTVFADGGNSIAHKPSIFSKSIGDEPGTLGGVKSGTFMKEAAWITYSGDVRIEGENACRLTDKMWHNHQNTFNCAGEMQAPLGDGGPGSDICKLLAQLIETLIFRDKHAFGGGGTHGLLHRFKEQINGQHGPGTPKWQTHEDTIKNQQRGLRNRLDEWNKNRCGPPPPGAWEWATKPVPQPKQWIDPNASKFDTEGALKTTAAVAGTAAGVYVVYRVVRFLPSLLPPLWWTIPANAAIP